MTKMNDVVVFRPMLVLAGISIVFLLFLYGVKSILAPFVFALIVAYFLAPVISYLEKFKLSRTLSTIIVMCLLAVLIITISLTIIPILYKQISLFISKVIEQKEYIANIVPFVTSLLGEVQPEISNKIGVMVSELSHEVLAFVGSVLKSFLQSGINTVNIISLVFVAPIVLFYTLRDWDRVVSSIQSLFPKKFNPIAKKLFNEIDYTLSGYVRGQTYVCLFLGLFYAVGLTIVGLESGFVLGMISGLLTFIPYAGAIFSCVLCILISLMQFAALKQVLVILALFAIGQFLEGQFVVPRFIGKNVNLHPVWIIFGLLAGGALMGFIGVLIALPLTAIIGVVIRFILSYYYKSKIYS